MRANVGRSRPCLWRGAGQCGMVGRSLRHGECRRHRIHLSLIFANQTGSFGHMNASRELAISPNGQRIVYVAMRNGKSQLFLRALGEPDGKSIEGTDGAVTAFFSPDSEWIAFGKGSVLQKASLGGGSPVTICQPGEHRIPRGRLGRRQYDRLRPRLQRRLVDSVGEWGHAATASEDGRGEGSCVLQRPADSPGRQGCPVHAGIRAAPSPRMMRTSPSSNRVNEIHES